MSYTVAKGGGQFVESLSMSLSIELVHTLLGLGGKKFKMNSATAYRVLTNAAILYGIQIADIDGRIHAGLQTVLPKGGIWGGL